jgi:hypothetical protein
MGNKKHSKKHSKKNSKKGQRVQRSFGLVQTPHLRITLPFVQTGIISESGAGLGAFQTFVINGAFDPFRSVCPILWTL